MYSRLTELFEIEYIICIKLDLALNNLQRLICHKTLPTSQQTITSQKSTKGQTIKREHAESKNGKEKIYGCFKHQRKFHRKLPGNG